MTRDDSNINMVVVVIIIINQSSAFSAFTLLAGH